MLYLHEILQIVALLINPTFMASVLYVNRQSVSSSKDCSSQKSTVDTESRILVPSYKPFPRPLFRLFPGYVMTSTRTSGERQGSAQPAWTISAGSDGFLRFSPNQSAIFWTLESDYRHWLDEKTLRHTSVETDQCGHVQSSKDSQIIPRWWNDLWPSHLQTQGQKVTPRV